MNSRILYERLFVMNYFFAFFELGGVSGMDLIPVLVRNCIILRCGSVYLLDKPGV
jgi:hypothetical protein